MTKPCKLHILRGCVFRQSHPAVVGVRVEAGTLTTGVSLIKRDGSKGGVIKSMQEEDDLLFSDISEHDFIKFKQLRKYLTRDEIAVLKEIAEIKRKQQPMWGV